MAAILRLAGGLDRSRSQQVRDVRVRLENAQVFVEVEADQEPLVDMWGAERRTDLFEKVFGLPITIQWAGTHAASPAENAKQARPRRKRRTDDADAGTA
jgi:exopolyphosphatase/guanosine-5'-triphosphate,3'-diphosphate pyrophosphatase